MFVPSKPFQTGLMFARKAGAYHFRCSYLGYAFGLTRKHDSSLEKLAKAKHSSLFGRYKERSSVALAPDLNVLKLFSWSLVSFTKEGCKIFQVKTLQLMLFHRYCLCYKTFFPWSFVLIRKSRL